MFGNTTVAAVFGIGFAAWVYGKMIRRTGNNTKSSLMTAAFCGLIGFIVILTLLSAIF